MAGPNTTREALIAELLGDVGLVLDRAEAMQKALPDVADLAATQIHLAGEQAAERIAAQAQQLTELLGRERQALAEPVTAASQAARAAQAAAELVDSGARRLASRATLLGMAAGALAGGIVGAAVASMLMV